METFTDPRDGETYKIVQIGDLTWFAESLRYRGVNHHFPNRNSDSVPQYGCLYDWSNAMKACPEGWRLPTKDDFDNLLAYVDKNKTTPNKFLTLIKKSTAWTSYIDQGSDEFGFGVMPAGCYNSGDYILFSNSGFFWSSIESSDSYAYRLYLGDDNADVFCNDNTFGFSVRCVKEA